ncbi:MAG TPA: hypothetical protein VGI19_05985, partial [Candidatus Cybelea sp.]
MFSLARRPAAWSLAAALAAVSTSGCAGNGVSGQPGALMPISGAGTSGGGGALGNAVVRIFVPAAPPPAFGKFPSNLPPPSGASGGGSTMSTGPGIGSAPGIGTVPAPVSTPPVTTSSGPPPPGAQVLAINFNGPAAISQTVTVGPNASGCVPATGGTACQVSLSIPIGTYVGTIGAPNSPATTAAFTVTPNGQNVFGVTIGGVPAEVAI